MKVEMNLHGMEGVLSTLKSLPPELVSRRGGPVRAALRKGAMVIVTQARSNFKSAVAAPGKTGITESTGFTEKNIVPLRKNIRGGKGERYIVAVSYKDHPTGGERKRASRRTGKSKRRVREIKRQVVKANDIAFMMEYGTSKQAATPWLRPAFKTKAQEAIQVTSDDLVKRVNKIVKKLAQQNAGKR